MLQIKPDQKRILSDAVHHYDQYIALEREMKDQPGWMRWKPVNHTEYLVQGDSGGKNQKSLGKRDGATEQIYSNFLEKRESLASQKQSLNEKLGERAPQVRALGMAKVPNTFGRIVRQYDVDNVLGHYLWVGGTHAIYAYEILSGYWLDSELGATEDLDLVWPEKQEVMAVKPPLNLLGVLKGVDSTFTVNAENEFQVRNSKGVVVDFITSMQGEKQTPKERLKPIGIDGQEWLMLLDPVSVIAFDDKGLPLKIVAPDPRLFALHKLWVSRRENRNNLKRDKDTMQGEAVIQLVKKALPQYKFDDEFLGSLPDELRLIASEYMLDDPLGNSSSEDIGGLM